MGQPTPKPGRVKITIESARCINKSWDGLIEFDGHGNEMSVAYSYRIYSPGNISAARSGADGTVIFGSNVNGMTRRGTETPDLGGITNGDEIPIGKIVMDEHINADDIIILAPTVWEWDGPEKNTINNFNAKLNLDLDWAINQRYPFAATPVSFNEPFADRVIKIFDKYPYGQALKYHSIFKDIVCPGNAQGNRAIGIRSGTFGTECLAVYPPTLLVLDTKVLYGLYVNNQSSKITGTSHAEKEAWRPFIKGVTIPFSENTYNIQTSNGSYTVFLNIEFIPDATSVSESNLTGFPNKNITAVTNNIKTIKNNTPANIIISLPGNWAGIQTNDYGSYPQSIAFELTKNGEYFIKDANANIAASGTYTFSNNIINGSYKLLSSGETFSFTGTFDPATYKITGTLGSGSSVTGQGKWWATKK